MKEMIYDSKLKREILDTGYCLGLLYYIMNLGTHPTAYIKIPKDYDIDETKIEVNGGITYSKNELWISNNKKLKGKFIGWDYAHFEDYSGYEELLPEWTRIGGKKWTTEEIFLEVKEACYQIQKMNKEENK